MFSTDRDGYLSRECESCNQRFKVLFGAGSSEPLAYCPYCGHRGERWMTPAQVDYAKSAVVQRVLAPELQKFSREIERSSRGFLKIKATAKLDAPAAPPIETDDDLPILTFHCCNESIKAQRNEQLFCVICGKEVDMEANEQKKVFLSHKGVDKALVLDFKATLSALGYDPWIDDDAMPAGTALERGILQGMEDSCGVVFFITPAFRDEGFLETEVDYAIRQKRAKGDRFAIIALQFVDEHGNVGSIPKLLETYVWKKPQSQLEALREIVRALPVTLGAVDWREGIEGVVGIPKLKSRSDELSGEAKTLLLKAKSGKGHIVHRRYSGGEYISAGGNGDVLPDHEPRTVARWKSALEELQRKRLILDRGHKGEIFELTHEGFEVADVLEQNVTPKG